MKSYLHHKLVRMGRWQRTVAVLLLALAFIDITLIDAISPELCDDGAGSLSNLAAAAPEHQSEIDGNHSQPARDSHSDSSPASTDEDCFCCCSHILLGYTFNVATLIPSVRLNTPPTDILPSPPPQATFHPPRFA